jgi:hypothetical protein
MSLLAVWALLSLSVRIQAVASGVPADARFMGRKGESVSIVGGYQGSWQAEYDVARRRLAALPNDPRRGLGKAGPERGPRSGPPTAVDQRREVSWFRYAGRTSHFSRGDVLHELEVGADGLCAVYASLDRAVALTFGQAPQFQVLSLPGLEVIHRSAMEGKAALTRPVGGIEAMGDEEVAFLADAQLFQGSALPASAVWRDPMPPAVGDRPFDFALMVHNVRTRQLRVVARLNSFRPASPTRGRSPEPQLIFGVSRTRVLLMWRGRLLDIEWPA